MIRTRQFRKEDQEAVVEVYRKGLCSYTNENSLPEIPQLTSRFVESKCCPEGDMYDIELSYIAGNDKRSNFFVAEDEAGKIVGCVGVIPSTEFDPNEYLELVRMSVDNNCRGAGVANKLLEALEDWARLQGYNKVNLTTLDGMVPAVKFYSKNGFRRLYDKEESLDLTKYGFAENEKSNAVNVVHFTKQLD
jgi:N-acetylglutamate synthase-like GNAT family acetyltransferase